MSTDPDATQTARRLTVLVRELLAAHTFATLADLTDVLKTRCARLHVPYTPDAISAAYRLIGSNRRLTTP